MKKSVLLVGALMAAIAVALPSAASAARFETPEGELVEPGTLMELSSYDLVLGAESLPLDECFDVSLPAELVENTALWEPEASEERVRVEGVGPGSFECPPQSAFSHITKIELIDLTISKNAIGVETATMGVRFGQSWERHPCEYQGTVKLLYLLGSDSVLIPQWSRIGPLCRGEGLISGEFALKETSFGTNPILIG